MDPRTGIIETRLKDVSRVLAVSGGKGGVGKSSVSAVLSLVLSEMGYSVGLLDLDFCGPSAHVILGENGLPKEENGIVPPKVCGVKMMTISYYCGGKALQVRGEDISNAMIELLAITQWGKLDFLIVDMPPGTSDVLSEVVRLIPRTEFLLVANDSKVVLDVVRKTAALLKELDSPVLGTIWNMAKGEGDLAIPKLLGKIRFDEKFETAIGDAKRILETRFAADVRKIAGQSFKSK